MSRLDKYKGIDVSVFMDGDSLHPFTILIGPKGQGKHTAVEEMRKKSGYPFFVYDSNIEGVRQCIQDCQGLNGDKVFVFYDVDNMSAGAKNALLKICEEPPRYVHILMTVCNKDNLPGTIISRAKCFNLPQYSVDDLADILDDYTPEWDERILDIATNPGEAIELLNIGVGELYEFAEKIYNNILKVSTSNAFKIANSVAFKDTDDGFPVILLLKVFQRVVLLDMLNTSENVFDKGTIISETQMALNQLSIASANKRSIFDIWLLNIRRLRK